MKIEFVSDGERFAAAEPYKGATYVQVVGHRCPKCADTPLQVSGGSVSIEDGDKYVAAAYCNACKERVGRIEVTVSTLFGLEEDERVLGGPWKKF